MKKLTAGLGLRKVLGTRVRQRAKVRSRPRRRVEDQAARKERENTRPQPPVWTRSIAMSRIRSRPRVWKRRFRPV